MFSPSFSEHFGRPPGSRRQKSSQGCQKSAKNLYVKIKLFISIKFMIVSKLILWKNLIFPCKLCIHFFSPRCLLPGSGSAYWSGSVGWLMQIQDPDPHYSVCGSALQRVQIRITACADPHHWFFLHRAFHVDCLKINAVMTTSHWLVMRYLPLGIILHYLWFMTTLKN